MKQKERKESEVAQPCPTLCDPVYCSPPGSSVRGILQARILGWVAISFSRGSSQPRDQTRVSCIAGRCFILWATREAPWSRSRCFSGILLLSQWSTDVGNLISGSSAFSKTSLNIWKFMVHILLKPGLENVEHYFSSVWDECNCAVVWAFFGISLAFLNLSVYIYKIATMIIIPASHSIKRE